MGTQDSSHEAAQRELDALQDGRDENWGYGNAMRPLSPEADED